jgi:hypothetical protein
MRSMGESTHKASEGHPQLGSPRDPGVTTQPSDGDRAGGKESGEVFQ